MTTLAGKYCKYTYTTSTPSDTPKQRYDAWCAELGVSNSNTLFSLDGDDVGFPVTFAVPPIVDGVAGGVFSSEGALGFRKINTPALPRTTSNFPNVGSIYQLTPYADVLLTFHPSNTDCYSQNVLFQTKGDVSIITGVIRPLSGTVSANSIEFAIRLNGTDALICVFRTTTTQIPIYMYAWGSSSDSKGTLLVSIAPNSVSELNIVSAQADPILVKEKGRFTTVPIAAMPMLRVVQPRSPFVGRDMLDGGGGKITGTTKVKGSPDVAVGRRVRLIRERDGICIREAWSDPITGAYQFLNINPAVVYTVITYDHTKNYRAVIADGLVPELMT